MHSFMDRPPQCSDYHAKLDVVTSLPIFADLPMDSLKLLAYLSTSEAYKAGEAIFQSGEIDARAYLLLEGAWQLSHPRGGDEPFEAVSRRKFIGGFSLFCEMKRLFTLQALSNVTCLVFTRDAFQKVLLKFPEVAGRVMEKLARDILLWESEFLQEHVWQCDYCRERVGVSLF